MLQEEKTLFLENQLCFPLYAASRLTIQLYGPLLKKLDLTYPQYLVMLVLWQFGRQHVNDICQKLYLESNTVTPLLKRLQEKQLVLRQRNAQDERVVEISLTEKGKDLRSEAQQIPNEIAAAFCHETMDMKDTLYLQKTLFELINTLQDVLRHQGDKES